MICSSLPHLSQISGSWLNTTFVGKLPCICLQHSVQYFNTTVSSYFVMLCALSMSYPSNCGVPAEARTPDPVIKSHVLYLLSYGHICSLVLVPQGKGSAIAPTRSSIRNSQTSVLYCVYYTNPSSHSLAPLFTMVLSRALPQPQVDHTGSFL